MNGPRFADADFIARDEQQNSDTSLGIAERGVELLQKINQIIDLVAKDQPGGPDHPIVVESPQK